MSKEALMTQTLDMPRKPREGGTVRRGAGVAGVERGRPTQRFPFELEQMSAEERIEASRHGFSRRERTIWAARYPDEVPLVNGEFEWIALRLP
jgi:hypothetical protein